ncbi:MAG TPA: Gfo/Idh/MocA family oxidoreductase [Bryobacteraceae bacterium]|nr:Gfo/Idh/MocA family oxidoreductase [Bryobacteraceae bacterium]
MRLAVAGLGFMGSVHLKAIRSVPEVTLAALVSRDESKLAGDLSHAGGNVAGSGERFDFSGVRKYRNLESALADPEIDAIDICLPTDLHEQAAIQSLRAGKHVLLEKPMAPTTAACERILDEARNANRVFMVAQVLRFFPAYRALIDAVPTLGAIRSATLRRRCARPEWADWQSDPRRSGGAVLDLLIHDIDMALLLFGPPDAITATGREERDIDIVSADLLYGARFTVQIVGGWHPGKFPLTMKYRAIGADGSIEYDFNRYPPRICRAGVQATLPFEDRNGYAEEIAYFARCVRSGEALVRCRPEESADAVRLALAIAAARKRNGERIPWKSA